MNRYLSPLIYVVILTAGCLVYSVVKAEPIPVHVFEQPGDFTIRLMPGACADPTSAMLIATNIPPQFHGRAKAIDSSWRVKEGGYRPFPGCWLEFTKEEVGEEVFFLAFSDGKSAFVPKSEFKKMKGQSGV
jgi:hypothetical protein